MSSRSDTKAPTGPEIANRVREIAHESGLSIRDTLALLRLQAAHPVYIPPHMMVDPRLAPDEEPDGPESGAPDWNALDEMVNGSDPDPDSSPVLRDHDGEPYTLEMEPNSWRRLVGDALNDLSDEIRAEMVARQELRELVNRLDKQVTKLVRTHPAGDADPEATDTKWLEETIADMDDRLHAVENRDRAERLDAGFRELVETELSHLKESIPGELATRLLRLERAARKAGNLPKT